MSFVDKIKMAKDLAQLSMKDTRGKMLELEKSQRDFWDKELEILSGFEGKLDLIFKKLEGIEKKLGVEK